ncbi:THAP domain-containing protein 11-like [Acipenser oxyrinchus oxyrinchus]|uniref:THAP domain-containing protein 11 n=1 Tax=Acipenser oxyrinchus oxyrinchus TaxID=40147 RepID=A0AAD8D4P5_ACIOX|nr:THAP domain-containing protein 11-like [Acipenser oxyrinchus oxyrinchus]
MPGFTCCVPGCYSNSHRDRELRFYTFPKDPVQRDIWLKNISRTGVSGCFSTFQPTTGHRVCSIHFPGGRKTYSIRVPTLFPLRGINEKRGRRGRNKKVSAPAAAATVAATVDVTASYAPSCSLLIAVKHEDTGIGASEQGVNDQSAQTDRKRGPDETKPVDLTVQQEALGFCEPVAASTSEGVQAAPGGDLSYPTISALTVAPVVVYSGKETFDHSYSLTSGTTSTELLKKLNEQRDIIALMEVKMKEMKSTIRQLRITEAKLREEVRDRDRIMSMAVLRKKHGV